MSTGPASQSPVVAPTASPRPSSPAWSEDMDAAPLGRPLLLIAREVSELAGWSIVTGRFNRNQAGWFATAVGNKTPAVQIAPCCWAEILPLPNRPREMLPHAPGGKFRDDPAAEQAA